MEARLPVAGGAVIAFARPCRIQGRNAYVPSRSSGSAIGGGVVLMRPPRIAESHATSLRVTDLVQRRWRCNPARARDSKTPPPRDETPDCWLAVRPQTFRSKPQLTRAAAGPFHGRWRRVWTALRYFQPGS